jgi:DNA mismatch endonuclease (patch repair protein)
MADVVSPQVRSRMMSGIRGKDTKPEMIVRRGLHAMGFRYRLHDKSLPGKPDLVLPKYKAVIFVHGCFWHKHDCKYFKWPKTRPEFWREKILGNVERDLDSIQRLNEKEWRTAVVWECAFRGTRQSEEVFTILKQWLFSDLPRVDVRGG